MADLIRVGMADYKVGRAPSTIISYGLGSCIGISLYDPQLKVGGLLHIMLPDSTQSRSSENPAKFADTGLPLMLDDVLKLGAVRSRLVAKIAGGAQMFSFVDATPIMRVGTRNAEAAKKMLQLAQMEFKDGRVRINAPQIISIKDQYGERVSFSDCATSSTTGEVLESSKREFAFVNGVINRILSSMGGRSRDDW